MYKPGTILVLKNQKDPDEETGEEFAYNRVEVIGESPVDHGGNPAGQWAGTSGRGVLLRGLTNFDAVLDEPFGKLQKIYDVEFIPPVATVTVVQDRIVTPEDLGPTPEDIFARDASGPSDAPRRPVATSPLPDPGPTPGQGGASPLEAPEDDSVAIEAARRAAAPRSPLDD